MSNKKKNKNITKSEEENQKKDIKENKDNKNKQTQPKSENINNNNNNEMLKLLKIVLIITGIMLVFYGITILATNKADEKIEEKTSNEKNAATEIQYENIVIGSMLNYPGTYYVLIEEKDDNRLPEYETLITTIKASEDAPIIYKANLTDSFNKKHLGKEANYYTDDLSEFKVTGTTLIKVKDGKIDTVNDSYETIKNKLNDLA